MARIKGSHCSGTLTIAFWQHVLKGVTEDACWIWLSSTADAYGEFRWNGKYYKGHRVSYLLHRGDLNGLQVLHTCDNRSCTNPKHLFLGTNADNVRDRDSKNRVCHGERHHDCKLTNEQVEEIKWKSALGFTTRMLAKDYKIDQSHVTRIMNGQKRKRG